MALSRVCECVFVTVTWGHYSLAVVFSRCPSVCSGARQLHAWSVTPAGIGQRNRRVQPELKHAKGSKAQSFKPQTQQKRSKKHKMQQHAACECSFALFHYHLRKDPTAMHGISAVTLAPCMSRSKGGSKFKALSAPERC